MIRCPQLCPGMFVIALADGKYETIGIVGKETTMKKFLVALSIVGILLSPAAASAGGYGRHHHHGHGSVPAEYLALGILGGVLGGIVLGHAISEHSHQAPPPRPVYAPGSVYYGPAYPAYPARRRCNR